MLKFIPYVATPMYRVHYGRLWLITYACGHKEERQTYSARLNLRCPPCVSGECMTPLCPCCKQLELAQGEGTVDDGRDRHRS